jgi:tmRNA-binding protein
LGTKITKIFITQNWKKIKIKFLSGLGQIIKREGRKKKEEKRTLSNLA